MQAKHGPRHETRVMAPPGLAGLAVCGAATTTTTHALTINIAAAADTQTFPVLPCRSTHLAHTHPFSPALDSPVHTPPRCASFPSLRTCSNGRPPRDEFQ